MRLSQIRDFVSIVEAGSIRAAARSRNVSQPTMTKSIRALEGELRVRLLDRTTHGIVPTASGKVFFLRARAVQAELRKADEELAQLAGERGGSVALGVSAAGVLVIADAIVRFRRQNQLAYVRIVEASAHALLPWLRDETLDFLVVPKPGEELKPQLKARPLCQLPLVIVGRRGHPLRNAKSLGELTGAPWVLLSASGWAGAMLQLAFSASGLPRPRSIIQCESYAAAIALIAKTDTLGIVSPQQLADPMLRGHLHQIVVSESLPPVSLVMLTRAGVSLTPVAAAMVRAITMAARELTRPD